MTLSKSLIFLFIIWVLQGCSSLKKPYSAIIQSPPDLIKTSVGNTEIWKWEPSSTSTSMIKGVAYLIPGFPGSSLENAPLAQELLGKGYSIRLINPPGHGQSAIGNTNWNYNFTQYGHALYESFQQFKSTSSTHSNHLIIAHSAGAEMVLKLLLLQAKTGGLSKQYNIVFINRWLPSISNHPIPWTEDDENTLKYSPALVRIFGPILKDTAHKRLFSDPNQKQSADYLAAHEKLTEDLGGWGIFDGRFVRLMIGTTHTQKNILQQGANYELPVDEVIQLRKALHFPKMNMLIINSSAKNDKVIPSAYKSMLKKSLESKLPNISLKFIEILKGGHMLQIEQPQQVFNAITQ